MRISLGANLATWRNLVLNCVIALLSLSLSAQENAAAILRSNGGVLVNNNAAPSTSALYPGVLIETQKGAAAVIEVSGSRVDIASETLLTFEGVGFSLDHGSLSIYTSRGTKVRVGCLMISPVNEAEWTRYEVTDLNSSVTIAALKGDVYVDARGNGADRKATTESGRELIREGERKSRDEKCGRSAIKESATIPALGAILNSPWAIGGGAVAIGVLTCWSLCRGSQPLSPKNP